jgi:hypothetical protein
LIINLQTVNSTTTAALKLFAWLQSRYIPKICSVCACPGHVCGEKTWVFKSELNIRTIKDNA